MGNLKKQQKTIKGWLCAFLTLAVIWSAGAGLIFAESGNDQPPEPEADLSNVLMPALNELDTPDFINQLSQDHFAIVARPNDWVSLYEMNVYQQVPSYVTADIALHFQHYIFSYLLRQTEKDYLTDRLADLAERMVQASNQQLADAEGSDWEQAAVLNRDFFQIGQALLEEEPDTSKLSEAAAEEYTNILAAQDMLPSPLFSLNPEEPQLEDYSLYKPRGYYTQSPEQERYFRAMTWFGRANFALYQETLRQAAILQNLIFQEDAEIAKDWENIYQTTALFAGPSDDISFTQLTPLINECYGEKPTLKKVIEDNAGWEAFAEAYKELPLPKIYSHVRYVEDSDDDEVDRQLEAEKALGFRFIGQRYSLDEEVFGQLVWNAVKENLDGEKRGLPSVLDLAAVFGSAQAEELLKANGDFDFQNFPENLAALKEEHGEPAEADNFTAKWLQLLRPLLKDKSQVEGYYPSFMRGDKWARRNLECFAGSFTELKHDTILYSKQMMAEMGGIFQEEVDDRGYVQPVPEIFRALADLSRETADSLAQAKMLEDKDQESLNIFIDLCEHLAVIADTELAGEVPSEEDFEFIKSIGGSLDYLKTLVTPFEEVDGETWPVNIPEEIAADIATDPNSGQCLELAIGSAQEIWVIVPVDGVLRLAKGAAYDFYEFPVPTQQRLTDEDWQLIYRNLYQKSESESDLVVTKPAWTEDYRFTLN
ncbi:MAG: DUF3160 domain-containing protein [Eubacteriales bacterium]|nr:DUF3160 domain-containing protein [Eubacteriales bacterium]